MFNGHSKSNFFGGNFDFNGDGKTDIGEQFLAYMIFEEIMGKQAEDEDNNSDDIGFKDFFR